MNKWIQNYAWLQVAAITLTLATLLSTEAEAGVEFVAPIGNCTSKVDAIGDGKDLFIIAGQNVQFEVFGNSVDLSNPNSGFRMATDSGTGTASARIIRQRGGLENLGRGCGNVGSAEVEVDSSVTLTSNIQRSLFFKMPGGDESRLQMTIKALPSISGTVWTTTNIPCIVKTGSVQKLNQDKKVRIQLPAGHQQDQTTCNDRTLGAQVHPTDIGELDIQGPAFTYAVTGRPSFLSSTQVGGATGPKAHPQFSFSINVAGIRALNAVSNSNITITSPNTNRTVVLNLEVLPQAANGFTATASCNPPLLVAGDLTDCTITLATAPTGNGQAITWRMTTANCFTQAVATAPYNANAAFQLYTFPAGQTSANIRVRSVNNGGCTSTQTVIGHVFEAWIGNFQTNPQVTTPTSGPTYTKTLIKLKSPN